MSALKNADVLQGTAALMYLDLAGEDPPVVFIHGFGAMGTPYFTGLAGSLPFAARRRIVVDLLGFGLSDRPRDFSYTMTAHADVLADALRSAEVSGALVVAHSMGGAIAAHLAARHPDLVSALTLIEPVVVASAAPDGLWATVSAKLGPPASAAGFSDLLDWAGETWAATMRLADTTALFRSARNLHDPTSRNARDILLQLRMPVHIVMGGDSIGYEPVQDLGRSGIPVSYVPDAGHNVMLDNLPGLVDVLQNCR